VELLSRARRALNTDDDALAAHRNRIRQNFSLLGALALAPFALLHLAGANWPMFAVNVVLVSAMLLNFQALKRGRKPPLPFWFMAVLMVGGACASVLAQGLNGVVWAYPALFMFFFVLPRGLAMVLGLGHGGQHGVSGLAAGGTGLHVAGLRADHDQRRAQRRR
jgi:hypothetical protein